MDRIAVRTGTWYLYVTMSHVTLPCRSYNNIISRFLPGSAGGVARQRPSKSDPMPAKKFHSFVTSGDNPVFEFYRSMSLNAGTGIHFLSGLELQVMCVGFNIIMIKG
jgi:hypothetical protein